MRKFGDHDDRSFGNRRRLLPGFPAASDQDYPSAGSGERAAPRLDPSAGPVTIAFFRTGQSGARHGDGIDTPDFGG